MTRWAVCTFVACLVGGCVDELGVLGPDDGVDGLDAGRGDAGMAPDAGVGPQAPGRTVAAGDEHTCAVVDGTLWCWGGNADGQLATGDRTTQPSPQVVGDGSDWVQVGAGKSHSCATRGDGTVWCWGGNADGQLGQGDTDPRLLPAEVDGVPPPRSLSTTQSHVCTVSQVGALWCWGQNGEGQNGLDDWPPIFVLEPVRVGDAGDWSEVATGQGHSLGLRGETLYGWGRNTSSELGLGPDAPGQRRTPTYVNDTPFAHVSAGQNHSCAIGASGDLYCWGGNFEGQLGTGDRMNRATPMRVDGSGDWVAVSVDTFHGCGLREPGSLWCWGRNVEGQLGTGDVDDRLEPTRVGDAEDWGAVDVGRFHTCVQARDGSVWCTGENEDGRLGTGDTDRRNELTRVDVLL